MLGVSVMALPGCPCGAGARPSGASLLVFGTAAPPFGEALLIRYAAFLSFKFPFLSMRSCFAIAAMRSLYSFCIAASLL